MRHPRTFQVNEAWIVSKLNGVPVTTEEDGDFNVVALMDAASCFILGTEFVPAVSAGLSEMEAKRLLNSGKARKQQLPKTLYVPENLIADVLCTEAERNGIAVIRVPEEQLLVFIDEVREGFKAHIGGNGLQ
ncbi:MAG: hypothetical protein K2Y09_04230 [Nitrosomonas sp.]|uniref:hypothetical protein n=1 Tax=Nitrosomonas sp. TaxID=42353 RepID=UPI001D67D8EA|nr:hypothetical protein [Nitrosomonas sp.]MBX9894372.1 hypothetical protein [Nitrosomonas sp.]